MAGATGALAGAFGAATSIEASRRRGHVILGVQSYSFRDRTLDEALQAMATLHVETCELWQGHVEWAHPGDKAKATGPQAREELRRWRLSVPLSHFEEIRRRFEQAGIGLCAYNYSFRSDFTDEEIRRGFEMARALGVRALTASANRDTVRRVDGFARRYGIRVGMHNHSTSRPNEFASPQDFAEAMRGASKSIGVNLDIGHFTAAGFDAVDYLRRHHDRIVTLHLKDRRRDQGPNMPFGQGQTPIREVLALLRDRGWPIPASVEYEYAGGDTVEEVRRSLDFCRAALKA